MNDKIQPETKFFTGKRIYTSFKGKAVCVDDFGMIVVEGKVSAVGKAADFEQSQYRDIIDLGDVTVVPGFIDAHVHLTGNPTGTPVNFLSENLAEQLAAFLSIQSQMKTLLKSGVTVCRDLGARSGLNTVLRDAVKAGILVGPDIISSGEALCVTGGHGYQIGLECDSPDAFRQGVRAQVKSEADLIKLMVTGGVNSPGPEPAPIEMTREEIEAAVETAAMHGKKVAVHTHGLTGIRTCVEAGVSSIEHGVFLTESEMRIMAEKGIYLVPTLSAPHFASLEGLKKDPGNPDHAKSKSVIETHNKAFIDAHQLGVPIAMGSDVGVPYNTFKTAPFEIELMVGAGMSELEALAAATTGSADLLEVSKTHGSLESGKYADFLILDADPLLDIQTVNRVVGVWKHGISV
ncbi:MAG: amidohydrolase family protein [Bacteroidetes bacterium]|nr:amidohydrolase family protein [Bacteroidota bacterium]